MLIESILFKLVFVMINVVFVVLLILIVVDKFLLMLCDCYW